MSDGTQLNSNTTTGDKIFTEDVGSASGKIQRMKIATGVLDVDGGDVATSNPFPVKESVAAAVVANQVNVTGAEAALPSVAGRRFRIKAHDDNSDFIYIGPSGVSAVNGFPLWRGDQIDVNIVNLNAIHAFAATGTQVLLYFGEV